MKIMSKQKEDKLISHNLENGKAHSRSEWHPYLCAQLQAGINSGDTGCASWAAESLATLHSHPHDNYFKTIDFDDSGYGIHPVIINSKQIINHIKNILTDASDTTESKLINWANNYTDLPIEEALEENFAENIWNDNLIVKSNRSPRKASVKDVLNVCKSVVSND